MRLGRFEHLEPRTLDEACTVLAEHGTNAGILAGGTDLLVRMKQGVARPEYAGQHQAGGQSWGRSARWERSCASAPPSPLTDLHRSPDHTGAGAPPGAGRPRGGGGAAAEHGDDRGEPLPGAAVLVLPAERRWRARHGRPA